MTQSLALIGALLLVLLLNAAMVLYFARSERAVDVSELGDSEESPADDERAGAAESKRSRPTNADLSPEWSPDSPAPPLESDGPTIDCRNCGATNEQGYQYCRWCISALGRDGGTVQSGANASGRTF